MENMLELVLAQLPPTELLLSFRLVSVGHGVGTSHRRRLFYLIGRATTNYHGQYKLGRVTTRDGLDNLAREQVELVVDLQGLTTIQQIHHRGT